MESHCDNRGPYVCPNCNQNFDKFDKFSSHIRESCTVSEDKKPYCIIFKGHNADSPEKKLHLSVAEYFYGQVNGTKYKKRTISRKFSCYSCGKSLRNNLRFMSHVRHKIENEWKENDNVNDFNICNHCYRHYTSPFHLQCHIETVHTTVPAATTCRICELNFKNEELFLSHMKDRHSYNELPYICKICSYRSSFYSDLTQHFRAAHENCSCLLCPFCLAIHHTANSYLAHVIQHMNKSVRCTRCRLQFFTAKDRIQHIDTDHKSVLTSSTKKKLPRNLNDCMIYVKVSHHPLSPSKNKQTTSDVNKSAPIPVSEMNFDGWSMSSFYDEHIPLEYRALVREAKVYVLLTFDLCEINSTHCIECGEDLGIFVSNYNKHFQKEFRCRICPYFSRCYAAVRKHILKAHLRLKVVTSIESTSKTSTIDAAASSSLSRITKKMEKQFPAPKKPTHKRIIQNYPESSLTSTQQVSPSASNCKSPKFVKRSPLLNDKSPTIKLSSQGSGLIKFANQLEVMTNNQRLHYKEIDYIRQSTITKKSTIGRRKRGLPDINTLLENVVKRKEAARGNIIMKSTKQRRKQLKPQKIASDEQQIDGETSPDSLTPPPAKRIMLFPKKLLSNSWSANDDSSAVQMPSPLLKPLSRVADEMKKTGKSAGFTNGYFESKSGTKRKLTSPSMVNPYLFSARAGRGLSSFINVKLPHPALKRKKQLPAKAVTLSPIKTATSASQAVAVRNKSNPPTLVVKWVQQPQAKRNVISTKQNSPQPQPLAPKLVFKKKEGSIVLDKAEKSPLSEIPKPPTNLRFNEITKSSFLVAWTPSGSNITEYRLLFQGTGLPTIQVLPPTQTTVRLIGLRSNTNYVVRVCARYKNLLSLKIEGTQRTLELRDNKDAGSLKIDDVIVLDDDDDDDDAILEMTSPSNPSVKKDGEVSKPPDQWISTPSSDDIATVALVKDLPLPSTTAESHICTLSDTTNDANDAVTTNCSVTSTTNHIEETSTQISSTSSNHTEPLVHAVGDSIPGEPVKPADNVEDMKDASDNYDGPDVSSTSVISDVNSEITPSKQTCNITSRTNNVEFDEISEANVEKNDNNKNLTLESVEPMKIELTTNGISDETTADLQTSFDVRIPSPSKPDTSININCVMPSSKSARDGTELLPSDKTVASDEMKTSSSEESQVRQSTTDNAEDDAALYTSIPADEVQTAASCTTEVTSISANKDSEERDQDMKNNKTPVESSTTTSVAASDSQPSLVNKSNFVNIIQKDIPAGGLKASAGVITTSQREGDSDEVAECHFTLEDLDDILVFLNEKD